MRKLRNYRLRLGWSLDDVAQQLIELGSQTGEPNLGVNADMVGRWERGERRPRAPYPKLLAMLYGCSAEELGVHQAVTVAREVDQELSQWGAAGSVDVALAPVDLGDRQPDREGLICAMRGARRIAPKAVGVVGSAIASCRRLDDLLGSRVALLPALAQRDLLTSLLEAGQTEDVRPGLLTAASEVAQFLGWLAFDMGDDSAARTQFLAALQAAHEARDAALAAYILGYLSILATCTGEPHEGVAFAEAAQSRARRSATATTRSWLSTWKPKPRLPLETPTRRSRLWSAQKRG